MFLFYASPVLFGTADEAWESLWESAAAGKVQVHQNYFSSGHPSGFEEAFFGAGVDVIDDLLDISFSTSDPCQKCDVTQKTATVFKIASREIKDFAKEDAVGFLMKSGVFMPQAHSAQCEDTKRMLEAIKNIPDVAEGKPQDTKSAPQDKESISESIEDTLLFTTNEFDFLFENLDPLCKEVFNILDEDIDHKLQEKAQETSHTLEHNVDQGTARNYAQSVAAKSSTTALRDALEGDQDLTFLKTWAESLLRDLKEEASNASPETDSEKGSEEDFKEAIKEGLQNGHVLQTFDVQALFSSKEAQKLEAGMLPKILLDDMPLAHVYPLKKRVYKEQNDILGDVPQSAVVKDQKKQVIAPCSIHKRRSLLKKLLQTKQYSILDMVHKMKRRPDIEQVSCWDLVQDILYLRLAGSISYPRKTAAEIAQRRERVKELRICVKGYCT